MSPMFCNKLRSKSGIEVSLTYDIRDTGFISGVRSVFVAEPRVGFTAPPDYHVDALWCVLINRWFNGSYMTSHETISFWVRSGQDYRYNSPDGMILAYSASDYASVNRPQLSFVAGDSWQEDPMQGDDWRNHNFNFSWLGVR